MIFIHNYNKTGHTCQSNSVKQPVVYMAKCSLLQFQPDLEGIAHHLTQFLVNVGRQCGPQYRPDFFHVRVVGGETVPRYIHFLDLAYHQYVRAQVQHVLYPAFQVYRALLDHGRGLNLAVEDLEFADPHLVFFGSGLDAAELAFKFLG